MTLSVLAFLGCATKTEADGTQKPPDSIAVGANVADPKLTLSVSSQTVEIGKADFVGLIQRMGPAKTHRIVEEDEEYRMLCYGLPSGPRYLVILTNSLGGPDGGVLGLRLTSSLPEGKRNEDCGLITGVEHKTKFLNGIDFTSSLDAIASEYGVSPVISGDTAVFRWTSSKPIQMPDATGSLSTSVFDAVGFVRVITRDGKRVQLDVWETLTN